MIRKLKKALKDIKGCEYFKRMGWVRITEIDILTRDNKHNKNVIIPISNDSNKQIV